MKNAFENISSQAPIENIYAKDVLAEAKKAELNSWLTNISSIAATALKAVKKAPNRRKHCRLREVDFALFAGKNDGKRIV